MWSPEHPRPYTAPVAALPAFDDHGAGINILEHVDLAKTLQDLKSYLFQSEENDSVGSILNSPFSLVLTEFDSTPMDTNCGTELTPPPTTTDKHTFSQELPWVCTPCPTNVAAGIDATKVPVILLPVTPPPDSPVPQSPVSF